MLGPFLCGFYFHYLIEMDILKNTKDLQGTKSEACFSVLILFGHPFLIKGLLGVLKPKIHLLTSYTAPEPYKLELPWLMS